MTPLVVKPSTSGAFINVTTTCLGSSLDICLHHHLKATFHFLSVTFSVPIVPSGSEGGGGIASRGRLSSRSRTTGLGSEGGGGVASRGRLSSRSFNPGIGGA